MTTVIRTAALSLLVLAVGSCRPYRPPAPVDQPIAFYHNVHAGQNQIPCMYCHYSADRSVDAGIPSVRVCVGCHVPASSAPAAQRAQAQLAFPRVKPGNDSTWHREGLKLVNYWRLGQSIPWVRIHKLPDHVRFPHYVHVNVGLECASCHGDVAGMQEVRQVSSLRMGWCISCHRGETELTAAEQQRVTARSSFIRRMRGLQAAGGDRRGQLATYPRQRASTDCMVCHY